MNSVQLSLLEPNPIATLPKGFAYRPELVMPGDEAELMARFGELPFREFEFHRFLGKRRTVSFGLRYDFADSKVRRVEDIPDFLLPLLERAAACASQR